MSLERLEVATTLQGSVLVVQTTMKCLDISEYVEKNMTHLLGAIMVCRIKSLISGNNPCRYIRPPAADEEGYQIEGESSCVCVSDTAILLSEVQRAKSKSDRTRRVYRIHPRTRPRGTQSI
jgi:hypothetical protein